MTGRDLIVYILENGLENEPVFKDGKLIGFVTAGEAAEKMNVGIETIFVLLKLQRLKGISIGNVVYIPADFEKTL